VEKVAEAAAAVASARRRLAASRAADGLARGALAGALAGGAAWLVARWTSADAGLWPLAAPALGALAGSAIAARRGVAPDVAALTLDAAARTEEAFVSALSVRDAAPQVREIVAGYAVARCPPSAVGRFLPFRAPAVASAAAVATALLAALVLVPRAAAPEPPQPPYAAETARMAGGASAGAAPAASPRDRVERLRDAVSKGDVRESEPLAAPARKDLGAVTTEDLRHLADALAASPSSAGAAKRALAALDRGDRAAAVEALREALGGAPSAAGEDGTGTGTAASAATPAQRAPWTAPTWPLRYDRVVRRWADETAGAEASHK
jgi:hypothetical protein